MANKRLSEGVGKKIVEALKKQSEIEVNPKSTGNLQEEADLITEDNLDIFEQAQEYEHEDFTSDSDFLNDLPDDDELKDLTQEAAPIQMEEQVFTQPQPQPQPAFGAYQQQNTIADNFVNELDNFEIPSNIAVLKKLITQLPSGVTRHTGAQIIRQTMEALGISMKSVLQEAQQIQEGLSNSARECQSTIQEYKKQIISLEKQSQNHQRQYAALNELISLFIQTGR